ncbi:MAG: DUF1430 domain-containing protein [Clostridium sp.]|uniref:DUF1430 domain-containing protein n=1 Tax=Clostridium chrysemydis TaxID=2665504 RepID=UPI003EE5733C
MKKVISFLLLITSIISFYIVYGGEINNYAKNMNEIEKNAPNSYQLMIPVEIDSKDKEKNYESIVKLLERHEAGIYYDRMSADERTRIKYIYDKNDLYLSNIKLIDGENLTFNSMGKDKYLSTRKPIDEFQIGRIATFNKNIENEIKTLKSMVDDNFNFSGSCYVIFKNNIDIKNFINELEEELNVKGITTIDKVAVNANQDNNYKVIVGIIYFIVMLLILYEMLNSYKKIGVKKLLGYSVKDIYIENILNIIKINLGIGIIVAIVLSFISFNQLNIYVYEFMWKFIAYILIGTMALIAICSIAYSYIFFVRIPEIMKNKKPLTGIIVLNYSAKIICLIAMMFFMSQAINNTKNIKGMFDKTYSNWEELNEFFVIPTSNIPIEALNNSNYLKVQKKLYKEFNEKGAIFANFNEFSPAIRGARLGESNYYYESDNVFVNPNYLKKYKIYDSNNNEVVISEDNKNQIILVPEKYKSDEKAIKKQADSFKEQQFYAIGENQKTEIIWTKSNQKIFTASVDINPDEDNEIIDPIIYVLTENNASVSDYNYLMGVVGSPFKFKADKNETAENTIREVYSKYGIEDYIGTIVPVNEQVSSSIESVKDNIKNSSAFIILLILVVCIIIIQNSINYFDKYRQKLSTEKLLGYKLIDKHRNYFISIIICWITVFAISILLYKVSIFKIGVVSIFGFIIEIIISIIALNIIEKKKTINILKGE